MRLKKLHEWAESRSQDEQAWKLQPIAPPDSEKLRQLGATAAGSQVWEAAYWCELMKRNAAPEVARAVLDRLHIRMEGRLLDIAPESHGPLLRFLMLAASPSGPLREREAALGSMALPPLAEAAVLLFDEKRYAEAAALCALVHDEVEPQAPSDDKWAKSFLFYQLARSLVELSSKGPEAVRRSVVLGTEALRLLKHRSEATRGTMHHDAVLAELQGWLGERWESLGELDRAIEAFGGASVAARNEEDALAYRVRWAAALERSGEPQRALTVIEIGQEEVDFASQAGLEKLPGPVWRRLRARLGGEPSWLTYLEVPLALVDVLDEASELSSKPVRKFGKLISLLRAWLEREEALDTPRRYKGALLLAHLLGSQGEWRQAVEQLSRATRWEIREQTLLLEREILHARCIHHLGDQAGALSLFARLLPAVRRSLSAHRLIGFLGDYLECLASVSAVSTQDTVIPLTKLLVSTFERLLRRQPGGGARRTIRHESQRSFEAAVLALVGLAEAAGPDAPLGQSCLEQAWRVIDRARNPELRWSSPLPLSAQHKKHLRELEDEFHRRLRSAMARGQPARKRAWRKALWRVLSFEMAQLREEAIPAEENAEHSGQSGTALLFFLVDRPHHGSHLISLARRGGELSHRRLRGTGNELRALLDSLQRTGELYAQRPNDHVRQLRTLSWSGNGASADPDREAPAVDPLVPAAALAGLSPDGGSSSVGTCESTTLRIFPDDFLHAVPLEMLPLAKGKTRLGTELAIEMCLRSAAPAQVRQKVHLGRGWLGLGGVVGSELPGSRGEIVGIHRLLEHAIPGAAKGLLGDEATASNLEHWLGVRRPAVLHFATHGVVVEPRYPDACCLVLGSDQSRPEEELLPFRRIRELPLAGVELVVLSACSSLIGRSDRASGMEGLAWAFLEAGVSQVVASRYPVCDRDTPILMECLYRHLMRWPVAEALRLARAECLQEGMDKRQVGAWSVWT